MKILPVMQGAVSAFFPDRPNLDKRGRLRYRMIKEACGFGAVILLLIGTVFMLSSWLTGIEEGRDKLKSKVQVVTAEATALSAKLTKAEKSLPFFKTLVQQYPGGEILLDRAQAGETMNALKDRFALSSLRVAIAPLRSKEGNQYKNASVLAQECEISLSAEALSDEHIMAMLTALKDALPGGLLRVESAVLNRTGDPVPESLRSYITTGRMAFAKGDFKLIWQGMKAVPKPETPAAIPAEKK